MRAKRFKNWRINLIFLITFAVFGGISYRLFNLQVVDHKFYSLKAQNQHKISQTLNPKRGSIFAKDKFGEFYPLAMDKDFISVFAVPSEIIEKEQTAEKLSSLLGVEKDLILKRISKNNDPYEPIKSKITEEEEVALKKEAITGVHFSVKENRYYFYNDMASAIIGFVNNQNGEFAGQYGLEKFYNKDLTGTKGSLDAEKAEKSDAIILTGDQNYAPPLDGADVILTIDYNIQSKAEEVLKKAAEKWQAEKGILIVADSRTGAIKAMANWPAFDLNKYFEVSGVDVYLNSVVQNIFEPGSVIKPITMAIGIDKEIISPNTKYNDEGVVKIGGYIIKNFDGKAHGEKTMTDVLKLSLNTGVVFVQKKIPKEIFYDYFKKFGFSEKTGIDLPGEVAGNISNLETNRDINYATASFGQGIAITPIELVSAINVLANEGKLMKPYIVEEIKKISGKTMKFQPQEIRRVISATVASEVSAMMAQVIESGLDKSAKVDGYQIAGKTGTAQIPDGKGGYLKDETIHSFIGFAPAFDPRFTVLIKLDKPQGNRFASNTLSAFFGEMMNFLLNYYEIPPDDRISL